MGAILQEPTELVAHKLFNKLVHFSLRLLRQLSPGEVGRLVRLLLVGAGHLVGPDEVWAALANGFFDLEKGE